MIKYLFILLKVVVIVHLLFCLVNEIWTATFICLLNLILLFIADKVQMKFKYNYIFNIFVYLFLFCSLTLGEVYNLFNSVWYFDIVMHVLSSFIVSGLVCYVLKFFNIKMNSLLHIVFIISFAMLIESLWEITEFSIDRVFNSDMQKDTVITEIKSTLLSSDGNSIVSKKINCMKIGSNMIDGYIDIGLYDTMGDMLCALCGSILFIISDKINKFFCIVFNKR